MNLTSVLAISALACFKVCGQTPSTGLAEFEVASIKAAPPQGFFHSADSGTGGTGALDPTTFRCASCTLSSLILKAFALERYQFPGQQSLPNDAFTISAKIPEGATTEQFLAMLQNLLKDRFGLVYHFDRKEMQGYHLVVAKNGPKLIQAKESAVADADPKQNESHGAGGHGANGWATGTRQGLTFFNGSAQYRGDHQTTDQLAQMLANQLGKPVDDQTGLTGKYDIVLNWAGDTAHSANHPAGGPGGYDGGAGHDHGGGGGAGPSARADNASGLTLFGALQSQLGLRLVAGPKSVARIFVVDHVEKSPTAN